ncbi:hypothetical protein CF394_00575 [Tetzosporium hominis]|uniref:Type I restriction modification DNA specificity domain-containing protein n=1 Tax=Tetzosporium hominis TaxID=2020506 RepID=A0A264W7G2_9BACL|nr:hypothetical protein CF394_00575 [Tetzosporium hominis]
MNKLKNIIEPYEIYRETSIPFLKQIPQGWKEYPFYALVNPKSIINNTNEQLLSVYLNKGVIPYNQSTGLQVHKPSQDLTKYQLVEPGDFVMNNQQSWRGSVGVSRYRGIVSPAYYVFSLSNKINPIYGNYLFRDSVMVNQFVLSSKGVGSIQRNLYYPFLKRIRVPLPSRIEQDQIVKYLDYQISKINKFIRVKMQLINVLKEKKQAVINKAVTKGLNPNISLKPSGLEWLGDIPEHWNVTRIKVLFREREERKGNLNLELLTFSRQKGLILYSEFSDKPPSASDLTQYKVVRKGNLLMNKMQAWSGMFTSVNVEGVVSPDYSVFEPTKLADTDYYSYVFKLPNHVQQFALASKGVGTGFNRLYTPKFGSIYTILPPLDEQRIIANKIPELVSEVESSINKIQKEIELINEYKTRLISDVITGKIDVRNIEIIQVEEEDPDIEYQDLEEDIEELEEVLEGEECEV